ncbi:YebG family protein [Microbulbifer elongatus]|uniref:YebG family protein n=1 Tax=Microbulbifer elongatus TaxID=86173 RepID=UPI001CFD5938|nr:YebG family protein [Microbulbifer elongatus]
MAVVAVWKCDRDGAMFDNKKDAEEHDKMLELAANITALIERNVEGISEEASEEIGLMLAKRREVLAKACKGKPEALLEEEESSNQAETEQADSENVTPLAANQ